MTRNFAATAAARFAVILILAGLLTGCGAEATGSRIEAVSVDILVGKDIRIELRLIGPDGTPTPANRFRVTQSRLDMAPDGMAAMATPLRPAPSEDPTIVSFETDIAMAGRWALTIEGVIEGEATPISAEIIFTAREQGSAAPSATPVTGERRILYYRNPMGLADISPVPKLDSMGMEYITVYADEVSGSAGLVRVSLDKVQRAGVRLAPAVRRHLVREIRGAGIITPDEGRIAVVAPRFDGFVDRLFARRSGERIEAGAPLFSAWIEADTNAGEDSDDLLRVQADYLTALRRGGADVEKTANNLRQFGVPQAFIDELSRTRKPVRTVTLTAPVGGTILDKPALEGMRFSSGDMLFKIADLSHVWLITAIAEQDLGFVQPGQLAMISLLLMPGEPLTGTIAFVYPEIDATTRTGRVRIEIANPDGRIKIGAFGQALIAAPASDQPVISVPASAVIDDGTRSLVFVARGEGLFEPRTVVLGPRGGDHIAVIEGLAEGEQVVVAGTFLIDAESNLQAALAAFIAEATTP